MTQLRVSVPRSLDEAMSLLNAAGSDGLVVGGGTWVVPEMTRGQRSPGHVIELRRAGLDSIALEGTELVIGAACTYDDLHQSSLVRRHAPVLADCAAGITGGTQIRAWGTIGGSACYARPASDVPGLLVGLDATLRVRGPSGDRHIRASDFFQAASETALNADEILTEVRVRVPVDRPLRAGYYKLKFCASSWPIATATAVEDGEGIRLALGGVCALPVTVTVPNTSLTRDGLTDAINLAVSEPWTDVLADGMYRRDVAPVVAARAITAMNTVDEGSAS